MSVRTKPHPEAVGLAAHRLLLSYPLWCCPALICPHHHIQGLQSRGKRKTTKEDQPRRAEWRSQAAGRKGAGPLLAQPCLLPLLQGLSVLLPLCLAPHSCFTAGLRGGCLAHQHGVIWEAVNQTCSPGSSPEIFSLLFCILGWASGNPRWHQSQDLGHD